MSASILIIEDDREMAQVLQLDLKRKGYEVAVAANGLEGLRIFQTMQPDLVVLDVALPLMDGLAVCQRIRSLSQVPILMMTAHAVTEEEIANGLDMGADEYMLKPLRNVEFHARVNALLRRARLVEDVSPGGYEDGYLSVNLSARQVSVGGRPVRLTPTEFKLLATFILHRGEVLTFQQILDRVWGLEYTTEHHYPRIYVSHLRRKIEPDAQNPTYIHSEFGVGYRFVGRDPV